MTGLHRDLAKITAVGLAAAILIGAVVGHLIDRIIKGD